jgi:hypothetical protein
MKDNLNQKGFAHIFLIVALVAIVLMAFVVWHRSSVNFPKPSVKETSDVLPGSFECKPRYQYDFYRTDNTLTIDPFDTRIMYVNVEHKGFFKSVDGGGIWVQKNKGIKSPARADDPTKPCYEQAFIAMDPKNPKHLILTGGFGPGNSKIYETFDGAETWKLLTDSLVAATGYVLVFDPNNPKTIYYPTHAEPASNTEADPNNFFVTIGLVERSKDGGKTWQELPTGFEKYMSATNLKINPSNSNHLLVSTYTAGSGGGSRGGGRRADNAIQYGILQSMDGGMTWQKLPSLPENYRAVMSLQVSPTKFTHVYAAPEASGSNPAKAFYSLDGGVTFRESNRAIDLALYDPYDSSGLHMLGLQVQPTLSIPSVPDKLYESRDGGATWNIYADLPAGVTPEEKTRISKIVWDPKDNRTIYLSGRGGNVWKSTDAGKTWQVILNLDKLPK